MVHRETTDMGEHRSIRNRKPRGRKVSCVVGHRIPSASPIERASLVVHQKEIVRATSTGAFGAGADSVDIGLLVSQYVGFCHGHDDLAAQARA